MTPEELLNPTPDIIKAARLAVGLTQEQAAELVRLHNRNRWSEYERGARAPDWPRWTLFLLLTGQHPKARLIDR
jgi:transcriptional regulator with XRE-family HTH domain